MIASPGSAIAIIGMAGRFPGAHDLDTFWSNLRNGVDSTGVPLDDLDKWDAAFFGFSGRDADLLDPQQRVFLECAWHALEDAGCDPFTYPGRIGVFAGASLNTYLIDHVLAHVPFAGRPDELAVLLASDKDYLATRLSYLLGLRGPSVGVQTACSTSLVAVHLARQSLLLEECDVAVAGAVTVRVPRASRHQGQRDGYLSPDGRCRAFDAAAAGTAFGSGAGVIIMKPLSRAIADRDRVRAIVRGSAINNDGARKVGYVAPSVEGQTDVIAAALRAAGVFPPQISYVEAHGTGTALGDPIEIEALSRAFGPDVPRGACGIGSVKTNIGHLESAAGIAGLIKVVLSLEHRELPPTLHFSSPNPHIQFERTPFSVNATLRPWISESPRIAGVSSFGIGGTNAHVVVEEGAGEEAWGSGGGERGAEVLVWSGRSAEAVAALGARYGAWLRGAERARVRAVCAAASQRRSGHAYRAAVVGETAAAVAAAAEAVEARGVRRARARQVAFVYSGQGGQWGGMGQELWESSAVFRAAVTACDAALERVTGRSVARALAAGVEDEGDVIGTQAALFAVQVGLTAVWASWGVRPAAVVAHSRGEVAGGWAAGVLPLGVASEVLGRRAAVLAGAQGSGSMLAVGLSAAAAARVSAAQAGVSVAAVNGPQATVLSGESEGLRRVAGALEATGVEVQWLRTSGVAGHSPAVAAAASELTRQLAGWRGQRAQVPWVSTVTGAVVAGETLEAAYWGATVAAPVQFAAAVTTLAGLGCDTVVEVGAHPVLSGVVSEQLEAAGAEACVVGSLRRTAPARATLLRSLATLYTAGVPVDWGALYPPPVPAVSLPPYPFQRSRHWLDADVQSDRAAHGLLGSRVDALTDEGAHYWQSEWHPSMPWLAGHRVDGTSIGPAMLLLATTIAAERQLDPDDDRPLQLDNVAFEEPLVLCDAPRTIQVRLGASRDGKRAFSIASRPQACRPDAAWLTHASGSIGRSAEGRPEPVDVQTIKERSGEPSSHSEHYQRLKQRGIEYGPEFQSVHSVWHDGLEVLADVTTRAVEAPEFQSAFDPGVADALLQSLAAALEGAPQDLYVPRAFRRVVVRTGVEAAFAHAQLSHKTRDTAGGRGRLLDRHGCALIDIEGIDLRRVTRVSEARPVSPLPVYAVQWVELPSHSPAEMNQGEVGWWLIVAEERGAARELATKLLGPERAEIVRATNEPADPDKLRRTFTALRCARGGAPDGVLYARPLESGGGLTPDSAALSLTADALATVQALDVFTDKPPRLRILTSNAQRVGGGDAAAALSQAPLIGLARVIVNEWPELNCVAIDLPREMRTVDLRGLAAVIEQPSAIAELALRGRTWYRPTLRRVELDRERRGNFSSPDATYVISGGLGGIALEIAQWLIDSGASDIALLVRRAPTVTERARLDAMRSHGAHVGVVSADVSVYEDVERAIAEVLASGRRIAGVLHLACVLDDGLIQQQSCDGLRAVFAAKATGAWNLHRATEHLPLDHFVLFSSAGVLLGSPGQANYVAANAFLDALAGHRRTAGLPAVSLAWGNWSDAGRSARADAQRRLQARGLRPIRTVDALAILERALHAASPQLCVADVDVRQWVTFNPHSERLSLWSEGLTEARPARTRARRGSTRCDTLLRDCIGAVLGRPAREIDGSRPFQSLGIDSLRALEVRTRLERELGIRVPATVFWRHPTIERLAAALEVQA